MSEAENTPLRKARGRYHHGNLRAALIEAAASILETEGIEGLSLRAAARAVGVSQTAPYRHFEDREALLAAVAEKGFEDLLERIGRSVNPRAGSPHDAVAAIGAAYVLFAAERKALFRLMFGRDIRERARHEALSGAAEEVAHRIGRILNDPGLGLGIWSAMHGLAWLVVEGVTDLGQGNDPGLIQSRAEMLLRGLLEHVPAE
ncbi:MAG: TetR/AcrR family transcriptional regulator [Alphaproteobacteria bacterium]